MQRRTFIKSATLTALGLFSAKAQAFENCPAESGSGLRGESQGYFEVRHQHEFLIPIAVLKNPPAEGYSARSTAPLRGKTDFEGLRNRTDSQGQPLDLRSHAHTVSISQQQLSDLANGKWVTIELKKFGHTFYFSADDATLAAIHS